MAAGESYTENIEETLLNVNPDWDTDALRSVSVRINALMSEATPRDQEVLSQAIASPGFAEVVQPWHSAKRKEFLILRTEHKIRTYIEHADAVARSQAAAIDQASRLYQHHARDAIIGALAAAFGDEVSREEITQATETAWQNYLALSENRPWIMSFASELSSAELDEVIAGLPSQIRITASDPKALSHAAKVAVAQAFVEYGLDRRFEVESSPELTAAFRELMKNIADVSREEAEDRRAILQRQAEHAVFHQEIKKLADVEGVIMDLDRNPNLLMNAAPVSESVQAALPAAEVSREAVGPAVTMSISHGGGSQDSEGSEELIWRIVVSVAIAVCASACIVVFIRLRRSS